MPLISEKNDSIGSRRQLLALIRHFKSVDAVKEASLEELLQVEGMTEAAAQSVISFFAAR